MKHLKKLLLVLLALTLCFAAFSCGGGGNGGDDTPCTTHVDSDDNGVCDKCKEDMPEEEPDDVLLIEDGEANFQIVMGSNLTADHRKMIDLDLVKTLKDDYDIKVNSFKAGTASDEEQDIEVLIGYVENRGEEYAYPYRDLGNDGYMIKIIGTKVLITAGSDKALTNAIEVFMEDILGIGEEDELDEVVMTAKMQVDKPQKNYKIDSLSVNGTNMKGYTIAVDESDARYMEAAEALQSIIYDRVGYWLEIVSTEEATEKSVVFKHIDKVYSDESFSITANGSQLTISCAFDNKLADAISAFTTQFITLGTGDIDFKGDVYNQDISVVYYEEFGADGFDGIASDDASDFEAIYNTHVFANECGQIVRARENARYYIHYTWISDGISKTLVTVPIMTNVEWGNAEFVIDDSDLDYKDSTEYSMTQRSIFVVRSNYASQTLTKADYPELFESIGKVGFSYGTTKIDLGLGYSAMIVLYNDEHRVYRRYGSQWFKTAPEELGDPQHELILLDAEGNIDESTPFMFDYDNISSIVVIRDDVEPLTITGGMFTTIACGLDATDNDTGATFGYYHRNIVINRSHTTVDGLKHYVTGEVTIEQQEQNNIEGTPYRYFLYAETANEVTFKNCVVTGRRSYAPNQSTYDIGANLVNKLRFETVIQSNFWIDEDGNASGTDTGRFSMSKVTVNDQTFNYCWGVCGTNFCKNMDYIGCRLSRYDAHMGLYNGSVIDSEINMFALTGKGDFKIENVKWYALSADDGNNVLISFRQDYGSVWDGTIKIKNLTANMQGSDFYIYGHSYTNWDFGYQCALPSLEISGLKIKVNKGGGIYTDALDEDSIANGEKYSINLVSPNRWDPKMHLEETKSYSPMNTGITGYNGTTPVYGRVDISNTEYKGKMLTTRTNLNPIKPPEYIKITDSVDDYYVFSVIKDEDLENGFFSGTDFICDVDGEEVTVTGTSANSGIFVFE